MAEVRYHKFFSRQFDKFVESFDGEDTRRNIRDSLTEFEGYIERGTYPAKVQTA